MGMYPDKKDTTKPGVSNSVASQGGYPSSGQISADNGKLPAQTAQAPYQHIGGGAGQQGIQGSQYKVQAQPMSQGVAGYINIPSMQGAAINAPKPSYVGAGSGMPGGAPAGYKPTGQQGAPPQPQGAIPNAGPYWEPGDPRAKHTTTPQPKWTPLADIAKMQHQYDRGGEYDVQARRALFEQMAGNSRASQIQQALAGRGANTGTIAADYNNLAAIGDYEANRSQMEHQANVQAFGQQMAYANMVNNTKAQLAQMAQALGMPIDDQAYNQMASEMVSQTGQAPSESQMLQSLTAAGGIKQQTPLAAKSSTG
jgi:hypothetical protein